MNIFLLNYKKKYILIANAMENIEITNVDNKANKVIFFNNKNVIGFNIFFEQIPPIFKIGRNYMNDEIKQYLIDIIGYEFNCNNNNFIIGKIIECEKIKGTHLSKTLVDIGNNQLQIVCGAKNVRVGLKVVVATLGVIMNNGICINKGVLYGVESFGMLCSAKELNLIENFNQEGIIEIKKEEYKIGDIFNEVYANR